MMKRDTAYNMVAISFAAALLLGCLGLAKCARGADDQQAQIVYLQNEAFECQQQQIANNDWARTRATKLAVEIAVLRKQLDDLKAAQKPVEGKAK